MLQLDLIKGARPNHFNLTSDEPVENVDILSCSVKLFSPW